MADSPVIVVDDRQVNWQFKALESIGFTVHRKRMETADLVWATPFGTVGVEDKPYAALLTDLRSGRLNDQLERLVSKHTVPILLLRDDKTPKPPGYEAIRLGRQLRGLVVIDAEPDFATAIKRTYEYTQKSGRPMARPYVRHYPWGDELSAPAEVVHAILQQIPRLSDRTKIAMRLAVAYSLPGLLELTQKQWQSEGFTKLQAERLFNLCRQLKGEV